MSLGGVESEVFIWCWKEDQSALLKFHLGRKLKLVCPEGVSS